MAECVRDKQGIHNVCQLCGSFEKLSLCSGCRSTWYCSKEHQKYDWKYHKKTCKKKRRLEELVVHGSSTNSDNVNKSAEAFCQSDHGFELRDNANAARMSLSQSRGHDSPVDVLSEKDVNITTACQYADDSVNKLAENLCEVPFSKIRRDSDPIDKTEGDNAFTEGSSEYFILNSDGTALIQDTFTNTEQSKNKTRSMAPQTQTGATPGTGSQGDKGSKKVDPKQTYISVVESRNNALADYVVKCLNTYGICVIDHFLGDSMGREILKDVQRLHTTGTFTEGQLVDSSTKSTKLIRGDILTWVDGSEKHCSNIQFLIGAMDALLLKCKGRLANYTIKERTKAMVACYPGSGAHYMKHVDNPNGDGRCVTCIYYLNPDWNSKTDGGILRIFPQGESKVASIEPMFDRLLFFWSDRRNPHEVMPALKTRYAVTVWYYDAEERKSAVKRFKGDTKLKRMTVPLLQ